MQWKFKMEMAKNFKVVATEHQSLNLGFTWLHFHMFVKPCLVTQRHVAFDLIFPSSSSYQQVSIQSRLPRWPHMCHRYKEGTGLKRDNDLVSSLVFCCGISIPFMNYRRVWSCLRIDCLKSEGRALALPWVVRVEQAACLLCVSECLPLFYT